MRLVRRTALVAGMVAVLGYALAPGAQARTTEPDGTFVTCNEHPAEVYLMVAGAPIYVTNYANTGAPPSGQPVGIACSEDGATSAADESPWYPTADGTFVQGMAGGAKTAQVYEVVGGAPLPVTSWAAVGQSAAQATEGVDQASIPTGTTEIGDGTYYGLFSGVVRSTYFKSLSGQGYRTDSSGHPLPVAGAPSTAPVVDQQDIANCVHMDCDPWGNTSVDVVGNGKIHVYGWALDGFATKPLTVQVVAAGQTQSIVANQPAPDVNRLYGVSGNYGFDRVLTVPAGHYDVCTTYLGYAPGATRSGQDCTTLNVPGAKPAKMHRPKVKAKGHGKVQVKWKTPATGGSPISEYVLKCAGRHAKQLPASKHKLLLKHLRAGSTMKCKVKAINGVGSGAFSKWSKPARVR